ncbi:semaphorin-3ab isoform X2 [Parambassis ranga]|uniref:Semaphorin-3ab isoform X2 n=1 Tax=Parambassis ranga TaxID=210632 RepID=A0A6P7HRS8_9TELE|nr:semaphorin-3ab-like isoform X2 [Parambassis ranga]
MVALKVAVRSAPSREPLPSLSMGSCSLPQRQISEESNHRFLDTSAKMAAQTSAWTPPSAYWRTHRLSALRWTKPRRNSTSSLVKLGKSLASWTNCRSPVCLKSARTMWEDRGLCRGSGRPLPKLLCSVSPPNSFPSTSSRMCSHCSHQRVALLPTPCSTVSLPLSDICVCVVWSRSTGPRSAVCVFRLQDFRTVFSGSYRTFDMQSHQWSPLVEKHSFLGQCGLANSSDSDLGEVKRSFLTSGSVQSTGNGPIVVSAEQQYSRVTVMRTRAVDGNQYTILFLLTESGFIHKVVLFERGPWVIEEIQVFREPQRVKNIVLSLSKGLLYVGTSEGVTAVPVANCSIYRTCSQCVLARDPMCGWSQAGSFCTEVHGSPENIVQRLEGGGMEEICEPETRTVKTVSVHLHKFVRLQCQKPSNTASLTWTSDRFQRLPENLFIQSADGSIQFLATSDTFGTYHCEAEEVGFKQVIVSYDVQQTASPRSSPKVEEGLTDESYENIFTNAPVTYVVPSSEVSEVSEVHEDDDKVQKVTTNIFHRSENNNPSDLTSTSHRGTQSQPEPGDRKEKSYFSELVAVSCLLVLCICALMIAALYVWQQRQADRKSDRLVCPEEGSKNNNCPESCSLSSPEDPGPDLKVVE